MTKVLILSKQLISLMNYDMIPDAQKIFLFFSPSSPPFFFKDIIIKTMTNERLRKGYDLTK